MQRVHHWDFAGRVAVDGEVENGLPDVLDMFGPGCEAREVVEVETGVVAEGVGVLPIIQPMQ